VRSEAGCLVAVAWKQKRSKDDETDQSQIGQIQGEKDLYGDSAVIRSRPCPGHVGWWLQLNVRHAAITISRNVQT